MEINEVPVNLLPIDNKKIDEDWASLTYKYAHCFSSKFRSTTYEDTDDLQNWIAVAESIQLELRELGVHKAHEKILDVFRDYGVYLPSSTNERQHPVNFDDVINIISDKEWYNERQVAKQALIHNIQYGIFRRGFNLWAVNAANSWIKEKRIKLVGSTDNIKRRGKGFVYSNLVLRASNSISDRIQKCMLSCYGEYIAVRKKHEKHDYTKITFNQFHAYIVRPHDMIMEVMTTKDRYLKNIRAAIAKGLKHNVTKENIVKILNEIEVSNVENEGKSDISDTLNKIRITKN